MRGHLLGDRIWTLAVLRRSHSTSKRQGFGSFHSEDIEVLVRQVDHEYQVPPLWADMNKRVFGGLDYDIRFGREFKEKFFLLDSSWTFLNHAAFGATLLPLLEEAREWSIECERQPLKFFDRELLPLIAHSVRQMANYLRCPPQELLPLPNVTTGLNAIVNSIDLKVDDEVVCFSLTYGSTKKILQQRCHRSGAKLQIIDIPLPIDSEEIIIDKLQQSLTDRTRFIVIDHITSNTAILLPSLRLAAMCKERGVTVVVDAAHGLFSQEVKLDTSQHNEVAIRDVADAWLTNGHKWLCAPKGCAFMWFNPLTLGPVLRPAIVSHGFSLDTNRILSAFSWDGCRDYSSMLSVPSALQFWELTDKNRDISARDYMVNLCREGKELLREIWGIHDEDMHCPEVLSKGVPMSLVPLPKNLRGIDTTKDCNDVEAYQLQEWLHHVHHVEVPVKHLNGRLYVRISAHVHNDINDFIRLARVVTQ